MKLPNANWPHTCDGHAPKKAPNPFTLTIMHYFRLAETRLHREGTGIWAHGTRIQGIMVGDIDPRLVARPRLARVAARSPAEVVAEDEGAH